MTASPTLQLFNLLTEHAPNEEAAFWRFATAGIARHLPRDDAGRARYLSDLPIALRAVYFSKFDLPDDKAVASKIQEALWLVEIVSALPPFP